MKTTVKGCMQLDIFKDAVLAAGEKGLGRKIRYASVLEPSEPEEIRELVDCEDRIFVTGFFGARDDSDKQAAVIRELADKKAAGLIVLYVGKIVKSLEDNVLEAANEAELPLIVFKDSNAEYGTVLNAIEEKVIYGDNFDNSLISNTIFHLLDFDKHANFQSALKKAAISNGFQMVLLNENYGQILAVETRHQTTIDEAIRAAKEKRISGGGEHSTFYTMVGVNGVLTYWGSVIISGEKYLMFIVDNDDLYTAAEITKLAEIIELAMGMWKYTPERDSRSEFIKAICRGNSSLARTVAEEADIDTDKILSVFMAKGIENPECERTMAAFEKERDLRIMKLNDEDDSYGLILDTAADADDHKVNVLALYDKLKETEGVRIFHVTGFEDIDGACDAYKLITEARSHVQFVFPFKRVFTKYELTLVCNCISIQVQGGFVKKAYMELLEVFKGVGGNKGRQLLETLETFVLDAGMNSSKTSDFMRIHPNTVQYRLKKINELLGAEITGNRIIPGLTIALALKRIERAL